MFSIPHTFASEDENYITIPALRRFAKEKRKEDLISSRNLITEDEKNQDSMRI